MYSINPRNVPTVRNYAEAKRQYDYTLPWHGTEYGDERPFHVRKKYAGIRLDGQDFVVRYHDTDLARFKRDGRVILDSGGWADSKSTRTMLNALTPRGVYIEDQTDSGLVVAVSLSNVHEPGIYRTDSFKLHIRRDGEIRKGQFKPWRKVAVDRKAARRALKQTNYHDFSAWLRAYRSVSQDAENRWERGMSHPASEMILADRANWLDQIKDAGFWTTEDILTGLRYHIYMSVRNSTPVAKVVKKPKLGSWGEYRSLRQNNRRNAYWLRP